jgi:uncharacterized membrane protein YebE (DUF533 family)
MTFKYLFFVLLVLILSGCQTTSQKQKESSEDSENVLSAVAGALSGKVLSKEEVRNLEKQIRTDKEAQSAIQVIADSVGGKALQVKYCPITGKRYAANIEFCPEHHVKLEIVNP